MFPRVEITAEPRDRGPTAEHAIVNPAPGTTVDRYVVLRRLGTTRHSDIYSAHDPELDRKVALKLLSPDGLDDADGYRRLMAEAQATARLAHPNVVKVHDVGTWRGRPYIAREFIEGASVHTWKKRVRPSRADVLRVMQQAGLGLAALHRAGLVHRDLNLHAILVGDDGSVRVTDMDFIGSVEALALPSGIDGDSLDSHELSGDRGMSMADETTGNFVRAAGLSGVFVDSHYASPEQLLGRVADARSDQFAFCVALYEALYDAKPFGDSTAPRRLAQIERGRVRLPQSHYSRRTLGVLKRGLAADPGDRYPTMEALLRALAPRRRRVALMIPVLVGAAAVAGSTLIDEPERASYCASVAHKLDGIWDRQRTEALREAFHATGLAYAADLEQFTETQLDAWVQRWTGRQDELCQAQASGGDATAIAREMQCLSVRRSELSSVVDTLVAGDTRSVENAARIVRELRSVESCAATEQWLASDEAREEVTQLGRDLAKLSVLIASHRAKEALPLAEVLVEQARASGDGPSLVRALGMRANALALDRSPEAETALHEAFSEALAQGQYPAVASIALSLAQSLIRGRQFEQAEHWLDHGEAALARGDDPREPGYAGIEGARGRIASLQGDFDGALRRFQRAYTLRREALGQDDDRVAIYRVNVGQAYQDLGRFREARVEFEAALERIAGALGPEHPDVARTHMALCTVLAAQGEYAEALEHGRTAQRVLAQAYGEIRVEVADAMLGLAMAHSGAGHIEESVALQKRAIEIYRATVGDRSYRVGLALNNLGVENYNAGNYVEAESYYRQALERVSEALGAGHIQTARLQNTLAGALLAQRKYAEAEPLLETVHTTIETTMNTDIPAVALWLTAVAELDAIAGRHEQAIERLQRAEKIHRDSEAHGNDLGQVRLMLASELRYVGRETEADALHRESMTTLQTMGTAGAVAIGEAGRFRQRVTETLAAATGGAP